MIQYFDFTKFDEKEVYNDVGGYPKSLQITYDTKIVFHRVISNQSEKIVEEIVNNKLTTNQKNYLVLCRYFDCLQILHQYLKDSSSLNDQNLELIFSMIKIESIKDELYIYYYSYQDPGFYEKFPPNTAGSIATTFIKILSYFYFKLNVSFIESPQKNFFNNLFKYISKKNFQDQNKICYLYIIPFFQNLDFYNQDTDVNTKIEYFKSYINKLTNGYKILGEKLCSNNDGISDFIEDITPNTVKQFKPNCEIHCIFVKAIHCLEGSQLKLPAQSDSLYSKNSFVFNIFSSDPNILKKGHPNFDRITNLLEIDYEYKDISSFVSNVHYHLIYKDPKIKNIINANQIKAIKNNLNDLTKYLAKKKNDESIKLNKNHILKLYELNESIKNQIFKSIERGNKKIPKEKSKQPDEIESKKPDEIETKQFDASIITINKEEILLIDQNLQKNYDTITEFKKLNIKEDFLDFMKKKKIDFKSELSVFFTIYDNIEQLINNYNEFGKAYYDIQMINNLENTGLSLTISQIKSIDDFCIFVIQNRSNFYLLFGKILKQLIKCNLNKPKYFDRQTIEKYFNINTIEKCFKISAYSTNNSESFLELAHIYRRDLKAWKYSLYKNDYKIDPKKYRYYLDASAYFNNSKANLELCKLFIKEKKYSNASYLIYRLDPKNPESYLIKSSALEKIDFHQSAQIILNFAFVDLAKYRKNIPYQEIIYSVLYARNRLFELLFKYFDHTFKRFTRTGIQTQTDLDRLYDPLFNEIAKKMNTSPEFGHKYAIPRIIFLLYSFRYLLEEITIFNSNPKIDYQLITDSKFLSKINELRCETEKNLCEIDLVLLYNNDPVKGINGRYKYTNDRKIYDRLKDLFYVHNYYPASLLLCQLYFEISRYNEMENSISKNKNSKINDSIIEINDEFINDIIEEKDRLLISQGKSNEFFLFAVNDDIYQFKKEAKIKVENDEEDKNAEDNETYSSLFKKSLIDKDIKFAKIFNNSDNDEKPTTEKDK